MSALRSAVLLTAVGFFTQAVGFVYRVLLSRRVGSEIMGLYHLVMPAYSVMMSLTAVGFTTACSTLTARYRALGDHRAARQVLRGCLLGFLGAFALVCVTVAPLSDFLSVRLLGDARTRLGLLLLLPCVLLTGLENLHKYSFYGAGLVRPPAFSEACEGLLRAGAVLGLLHTFLPQSPERTVGLMVCGMVLCEVFSALTLSLLYRRYFGRDLAGEGIAPRALRRQIWQIALPMGWTSLLGNLMGAAMAVIIPRRLVSSGVEVSGAMSAFGVLQGMTLPLLSLPSAFLSATALVLLPRLTQAHALGQKALFRARADRALTAVGGFLFPSSALLAVLARPLGRLLFREETVGRFALPLALAMVLGGFEAVLCVCLNGMGRQRLTARYRLCCDALQLALTWWRMGRPGVGLQGYVEALLLTTLLGVALYGREVSRAAGLRPQWFRWVLAPGLAALLSGACSALLLPLLTRPGLGEGTACAATLAFGGVLYLCAMGAMGLLPAFPTVHRAVGRL